MDYVLINNLSAYVKWTKFYIYYDHSNVNKCTKKKECEELFPDVNSGGLWAMDYG